MDEIRQAIDALQTAAREVLRLTNAASITAVADTGKGSRMVASFFLPEELNKLPGEALVRGYKSLDGSQRFMVTKVVGGVEFGCHCKADELALVSFTSGESSIWEVAADASA